MAPPSIVGHMVSTVPPKAEETIMTMHSPSGIHPAYQHGSDADVGNQILLATWEMLDQLWELCMPIKHTVGTWVLPVWVPRRGAYASGSLQEQSGQLNQCLIPMNALQPEILMWGFNSYMARALNCLKLSPSCGGGVPQGRLCGPVCPCQQGQPRLWLPLWFLS